jgi:hypothetical protein
MPTASSISGPVSMRDAEACNADDIIVLAEGGAICSESLGGQYHPSCGVVRRLCEDALRGSRCASHVQIVVPDDGLVLSDDVTMDRLESFGQSLQAIFQQMRARSVIVLAGSHKVPRYGTAATLALTPGDLGVDTGGVVPHKSSGSLVIASTRYAANVDPAAAVDTMSNAIQLSKHRGMQGRAAALFGDKLYALPGLSRQEDHAVLHSRFDSRAHKGDRHNWYFSERMDYDVPIGDGSPFILDSGVRTFVFGGESQHDPDGLINAMWSDVHSKDVHGVVIKKAGNRHPLTSCDSDKLESIDRIGIPIIAVGDRNGETAKPRDVTGAYKNILDGSRLQSGEAKLLLSFWLKAAENAGLTQVVEVVDYVRQKLEAYPFR